MFWKRKEYIRNVQDKEALIKKSNERLNKSMDKDIVKLDKLHKILSNGITLEIAKGLGNHHV